MSSRELVYRFMELPYVVKVDIATRLNLLTDAEIAVWKEEVAWTEMFKRASQNGQVSELVGAVEMEIKRFRS